MAQYGYIIGAIGRTPLVRLHRLASGVVSPIYAKIEVLNPGGRVKDRVGLASMKTRPRILFVCTGNSCRSQMAEAWARTLLGGRVDAHSAGVVMHGMDPHAVQIMREAGIALADQHRRVRDELREVVQCLGHAWPDTTPNPAKPHPAHPALFSCAPHSPRIIVSCTETRITA